MALRVLLADESTTIKKVMQLALQDFSVEVKAVHSGVDVLEVARTYVPDLIFADVLLQKKNGYEVAAMIKNDKELGKIPVVLMWSSFMDLDDVMARSCGAEARLEKPFDVETLRKLVLELVPKTRSQRLAHFLDFSPRLNEELIEDPSSKAGPAQSAPVAAPAPVRSAAPVAKPKPPAAGSDLGARLAAKAAAAAAPPAESIKKGPPSPDAFIASRSTAINLAPLAPEPAPPSPTTGVDKSGWSMESFGDPAEFEDVAEDFQPLELSKLTQEEEAQPAFEVENDADDEMWARQDLSEFKLDLPPISVGEGSGEFKLEMGEEEFAAPTPAPKPTPKPSPKAPPPAQMREQSKPTRTAPPPQLLEDEAHFGNDLTLEPDEINAAEDEIPFPIEPLDIDSDLEITQSGAPISQGDRRSSAQPPPNMNQLSAQELERVIRSQSREIIEQVVRKIVPELAASIIREELERLLEDTAVRENRNL